MKRAGVWAGLVLLIFSGTLFWKALSLKYYSEYGPGAGFFPIWMSGFLIFLSILFIIDSLRKKGIHITAIFPKNEGLRKVLCIITALLVFLVLVPFTGYTIAGVCMLCILFFREYKWYWGLGISVTVSLVLFFAFHYLLKVPLPVNSLLDL